MAKERARAKRPQGRPRQDGSFATVPRDEIIRAATRLFAERGYAFTTITQIANAAGLQQSSLYYWFRSKEDILLAALEVNRESLTFADQLLPGPASTSEKLYRLLRYDTLQLCLSPFDFNEIERLAESQPEDFSAFWEDYSRLHRHVVDLIRDGIQSGEFRECDPELAASSVLCVNEGIQKRYRTQSRHSTSSLGPFTLQSQEAETYADVSARMSLLGLLTRPTDVVAIAERVDGIDGSRPPAPKRQSTSTRRATR